MSGYTLTKAARADLRAIASYTRRRFGQVQLERYMNAFRETFQTLSEDPRLGRSTTIEPYYRIEIGRHVVFFRRQEQVRIVRVLHARMLPELHLGEED